MESFQRLIRALNAKPNPPATAAEIESFTQLAKPWIASTAPPFEIPSDLASIYKIANGFAGDWRLSFTPANVGLLGIYPSLGLVALSESNDSNPYCVACVSPLNGYVIRLAHDGDTDIQFRSVESFISALLCLVEKKDWRIDDLVPEIKNDNAERDQRDIAAGLELVMAAKPPESFNDELERGLAIRFGIWLLSAKYAETIAKFLDDDDGYVQESARQRLNGIGVH